MGFLNIFSAKDPQGYEQKGDLYLNAGDPGKAKLEYETALAKLEKTSPGDAELKSRLEKKILQSKGFLACEHKKSADDLMAAGYHDDARELYDLALELTTDPELAGALTKCLQKIEFYAAEEKKDLVDVIAPAEKVIAPAPREEGDEYFTVLCSTLPEGVKKVYLSYGDAFKKGYIALNQGQFEQAAKQLSLAMEENASPESFIPLELATAYLNLENYAEARSLLEEFVKNHPQVLPGYQLLCEIYWETNAFEQAANLLSAIPEELKESVAVYLLRGETFFRAKIFCNLMAGMNPLPGRLPEHSKHWEKQKPPVNYTVKF
jgi:tetratricopeptide (TPR) repeat protein